MTIDILNQHAIMFIEKRFFKKLISQLKRVKIMGQKYTACKWRSRREAK